MENKDNTQGTRGRDLPHQVNFIVRGDPHPDIELCTLIFEPKPLEGWDDAPDKEDGFSFNEVYPSFKQIMDEADALAKQLTYSCHPLLLQFLRKVLWQCLGEWEGMEAMFRQTGMVWQEEHETGTTIEDPTAWLAEHVVRESLNGKLASLLERLASVDEDEDEDED